jgi:predicted nucleic acid-binding protein
VIYLDPSAILKLIRLEAESPALRAWLADREAIAKVSSVLARIEVLRASRRPPAAAAAQVVLSGLDMIPLSADVVEVAAAVGEPSLRTLDAVHLASALAIAGELDAFCCYDHRLLAAAQAVGLPGTAPGREA